MCLAAAALASACAAPPDVRVELTDAAISADRTEMPAGHHVLAIHNAGTTVHELEVIRTDRAPADLPYDAPAARVKEREIERIAEKENIAPGATKRLAADLPPGRYVLLCNVPGHYAVGMRTALVVR